MPRTKKTILTEKQKAELMQSFCNQVISTTIPVTKIAEDLGTYIGKIYTLAETKREYGLMMREAYNTRAHLYMVQALDIVDCAQAFWEDEKGHKKECMTADRRAKTQADLRRIWASALAPDYFSDRSKEVKEMLKTMEEIRRSLNTTNTNNIGVQKK